MPTRFHDQVNPLIADPSPMKMIEFLQDRGLLASNMNCEKCQTLMKMTNRPAMKSDKCAWRCPKKTCRAYTSIRRGSWFHGMKVPIQKVIWIIHEWSTHTPLTVAAKKTGVSAQAIVQLYQYLRDVCSWKLMNYVSCMYHILYYTVYSCLTLFLYFSFYFRKGWLVKFIM